MKAYFFALLVALFVLSTNVEAAKLLDSPAPTFVKTYVVKSGDCLYKIARANHMSVKELYQLNKKYIKDQRLIRVGQKLIIGTESIEAVAIENKAVSASDTLVVRPITSENSLPAIEFVGNPSLDSIVNIFVQKDVDTKIEKTNFVELRPIDDDLSIIVKIKQVGILMNPRGLKLYTAGQIINSVYNKMRYHETKSFEISENGKKLYIRRADYAKLLLTCYGLDTDIYPSQNPELIIKADQLGIKYNTPNGQFYTRLEIALSMVDSVGNKKISYSKKYRYKLTQKGTKIYLDCSAFADFFCNIYGENAPANTTATIFTKKNDRHRIKSTEELEPGSLIGRPNDHVIVCVGKDALGQNVYVHSSGDSPLFVPEKQIEKRIKRGVYLCSSQSNPDLEKRQSANMMIFASKKILALR